MSLLPLASRPSPLPASPRSPAAARLARRALALLPPLLIGGWAVADRRALRDGTARLALADPWWLLAGLFFTCLGWVAAACARQGAVPATDAADAADHVLPASLGTHAVTLRFLRGRGVPLPRATASPALYALAKPLAKVVLPPGGRCSWPPRVPCSLPPRRP
ncbi:hypothetical protein AB0K80_23125 [Streptomyces sp. NPDC052682]|uniref:hypothetical protein n=1 Tax=Streptomyces sp. NPDC052682 TaxID=3154954 RepID=UPI0034168F39